MKLTNKHNLSEHIVKVLSRDEYDYETDVWSASALKMPSRMFALSKIHNDELETDVSDLIASRFGTASHSLFENTDLSEFGFIQEQRVYSELDGQRISGKYDLLKKLNEKLYRLYDIKTTSVWKFIYGEFDEYIKQLSIYKWLLFKNGYEVDDTAIIIFIFTDWSRQSAAKKPEYPQLRIKEQEITLMSLEETEKYIRERIQSHKDAFNNLPNCSDEELWKKKPKDPPRRCDYCQCQSFCQQYKEMIK